ncbi:hypothetical protein SY88_00380 [Clostridiales bacterium PH28_bin88]|nr:hypothetical protein SY88_00380 [Clostridiales bacterium PH28_bin88]
MVKSKLPIAPFRGKKPASVESHGDIPKVITFWSPKTAGKTTLAAAVAAALTRSGRSVACADFDVLTPDLPGRGYNLDQVSEEVLRGDFDPGKTAQNLTRLQPSGVHLLAGLTDPVRAESLGRSELLALAGAMAKAYDVVILDTNQTLVLEATLAALDAADLVIIPVAPAENQVRHVGRYLTLLEQGLRLDKSKIRVVANHMAGSVTLPVATVEQVLGRAVAGQVPYYRDWATWTGENLPPVDRREGLLVVLVSVPLQGPGEGGGMSW